MEKAVVGMATAFTGSAIIAGMGMVVKSAIDMASEISDASAAANMGGEDFQRLSFAFEQSGTKAEQFTAGMQTLLGSIQQAADNNPTTIRSFERLGISLEDIGKGDTKDILLKIADGMANSSYRAESMSAALDVLGKGGKKMVAGLQEGREAVEALGKSATVISERDLKALDDEGDRIHKTWMGIRATVAGVVAGAISANPFGLKKTAAGEKLDAAKKDAKDSFDAERKEEDRLASEKEARQQEAADEKDRNWQKQLARVNELDKFSRNAAKVQAATDESFAKANHEYAQMENDSVLQTIYNQSSLKMEQIEKEHKAIIGNLNEQADAKNKQLAYEQSFVESNQQALARDTSEAVRRGLMNPQDRRAEDRASKRVEREERRIKNMDEIAEANPEKRIRGGRKGDAAAVARLREDRNNLVAAKQKVELSKASIKELTDSIERLIVKP